MTGKIKGYSGQTYDVCNRRVRKVVNNSGALNGTTLYYLDRHREIEERNGTNGLVQQYVYGRYIDEPLVLDHNLTGGTNATGPGNQRLFYHQSKQHSIFALTDATGKIVEGYQCEGYGIRTVFNPGTINGAVTFGSNDVVTIGGGDLLGNPFGFTGRRYDSESGLYYYRNRYLAPDQGRFMSRDPIGYGGGSMGLCEYAGGCPGGGLDPSGRGLDWFGSKFAEKGIKWGCAQIGLPPAMCEKLATILPDAWSTDIPVLAIVKLWRGDVKGVWEANSPAGQQKLLSKLY